MHSLKNSLPIAFTILAVSIAMFAVLMLWAHPVSALTRECSQIASATDAPDGFGAAVNLFSTTQEKVISALCSDTGAQINVGSGSSNQYMYNQGYEYVNSAWKPILFSGTTMNGSWIIGSASKTLIRTAADLAQMNYVVAYICVRVNSAWKCGCRENTCATNYWQLQTFMRSSPVSPVPTDTSTTQNIAALKYKILDSVGEPLLCPPPATPQNWNQQLIAIFPSVKADTAEFNEILAHLGLTAVTNWADELKLRVVNEHRKLLLVNLTGPGDAYHFSVNATSINGTPRESTSKPRYYLYKGTITNAGIVTVTKQTLGYSSCPKCLARDTKIATPQGDIAVEYITPGMLVWTVDTQGERVIAPVVRISKTPVNPSHHVVHLTLADGKSLFVSPEHPTGEGRTIGELKKGDTLNGIVVQNATLVSYTSRYTYDILPSGETGEYFANGIVMGSTLK